jgi:hypothetical protein
MHTLYVGRTAEISSRSLDHLKVYAKHLRNYPGYDDIFILPA